MFRVFKNSIIRVKKETTLSMFFVLIESIFEIIIPLMMAKLIDVGIENSDIPNIIRYGLIIVGLVIGEALTGCLCAVFAIKASVIFASDIRERLFKRVQTFSFANIDKFSAGSLVTRSTTDIANVQRAFQMVIRGTIRSIGMFIFSIVFSFTVNVKIACMFVAGLPVIIISLFLVSRIAFPLYGKMFGEFDNLNNIMSENIHGIRVVKTFNREDYEFKKMKKTSDAIYDISVFAEKLVALWDPFMNLSVYAIICCVAWFGAKAIIASGNNPALGLTTGKLMSLLTYGMTLLMSLMFISIIYVMLVISSASIKRVSEVLMEETKIKNPDNPIKEVKDGKIDFNNVSFRYKEDIEQPVLKNINLSIKSGEMIGIIGITGSGKSSFANLIPRLYDVTDGEVKVGGVNVKNYDLEVLRKSVGIVLQKNVLFSGTIASNLRFGNENATDEEIEEALKTAFAWEFVCEKEGGINAKVEQGGTNFSGGQKQRLSIARTILKKPKILIFDESTSAVDTKTDSVIRNSLRSMFKDITKIIISERIISIKDCDKIIVFENGQVIGYDTHDNLINSCKLYKDINELQTN